MGKEQSHSGACFCGAVKFTATGEPVAEEPIEPAVTEGTCEPAEPPVDPPPPAVPVSTPVPLPPEPVPPPEPVAVETPCEIAADELPQVGE